MYQSIPTSNAENRPVPAGRMEFSTSSRAENGRRAMRMVVSAGGTGGHTNPALVIALELRKMGHTILFVGSENGQERTKARDAGFEFLGLKVRGFSRSNVLKLMQALYVLPAALGAARNALPSSDLMLSLALADTRPGRRLSRPCEAPCRCFYWSKTFILVL